MIEFWKPYWKVWALFFFAVILVVGLAVRARRWDRDFKAEVGAGVAIQLLFHGVDPQYAEPVAACVVDGLEWRVPEKKMRAVVDGRDHLPDGLAGDLLRRCACVEVKDPAALAAPGYCSGGP